MTPAWTMMRGGFARMMEMVQSAKSPEQMEAEIRVAMADMDAEFPKHAAGLADLESDVEKTRRKTEGLENAMREERLSLAGDREILQKEGDRFEIGKGRFYTRAEVESDARARMSNLAMLKSQQETEQRNMTELVKALDAGRTSLAAARARRQEMENRLTTLVAQAKSAEGRMRLAGMTRELRGFDEPRAEVARLFAQLERKVRDTERLAANGPAVAGGGVVDWSFARTSDVNLMAEIEKALGAQGSVGKVESK